MDTQLKEAWVAALRSGQYEQGKARLRQVVDEVDGKPTYEYCCLGVLCEIADDVIFDADDGALYTKGDDTRGSYSFPPREFAEAVGLKAPVYDDWLQDTSDAEAVLVGMNDDRDKTFVEIADWIERTL